MKFHEDVCKYRHHDRDIRRAGYVYQHVMNRKFKGKLDQSIELYVRDYKFYARRNKLLSYHQRPDYFVNTLDGAARILFFRNAKDDMSLNDTDLMMMKE